MVRLPALRLTKISAALSASAASLIRAVIL
jgi:hypothetical protein